MKSYKLSFGTIIIIKENLAEVIVNEGVVMDEIMVDEYHDFLLSALKKPFSLLINKKYSYTYTFYAQKTIGNLKEINAMAVMVGTNGGLMSTETLINLNHSNNWNIKLFIEREDALNWLENLETLSFK
ncbi:hypothetical protein APS56_14825 [Pseudalgibacter alginicilyticus]|uniref:STAS/SEC14 domain-containing protein n=1 Tax=Pseudalgibacter alginicilyticus TaxID=1736674 RepID=A0A0P0DBM8_9FLAO|nr:hypothetical protein [Pseudalgibacter alginicilyticus]ALJ06332.1 hypothetical protein APS56_14825 [Pseudalgibacter alginicilyticus]